jgi:hypothetical protein
MPVSWGTSKTRAKSKRLALSFRDIFHRQTIKESFFPILQKVSLSHGVFFFPSDINTKNLFEEHFDRG